MAEKPEPDQPPEATSATRLPLIDLTPEQERELRRLVNEEGLDEEKARVLVTTPQLDIPLGKDGEPLVPVPPT